MLKLSTSLSCISKGVLRSKAVKPGPLQLIYADGKINSCRAITSKAYRVKKDKPAPYPYEAGLVNTYSIMLDLTMARLDENSKLIVVEGPVNSGKNEVAKKIAEEFEMKYVPSANMDELYINPYGYDLRNLDNAIPLSLQSCDEKKFNENPTHVNVAGLQMYLYSLRFLHYMDCLAHLLNTGQGVVTVRSPFSDFIWAEAMYQHGYLSPQVKNFYYNVLRHSLFHLWRPHLVVYLDVPVAKTIENNKKRGTDYEANSKALTPEFLETIETLYKDKYLPEAAVPGEVLMADWSEEEDIDNIVEDIEALDFDTTDMHWRNPKFSDWRQDEWWYDYNRWMYTADDERARIMYSMNIDHYDTPELFASDEEWKVRDSVYNRAPGNEYRGGFNFKRGEKDIIFRNLMRRENQYHLDDYI